MISSSTHQSTRHDEMEDKNHMATSTNAEMAFGKIQHPHMIKKTSNRVDIEEVYLYIILVIYDKPIANTVLSSEKLSFSSLDQQQDKDDHPHHFHST